MIFSITCHGGRSNVDEKFSKECCMEIGFPIDDENAKNHKGSDVFRVVDSYFQLRFRNGHVWDLIDEIFTLWKKFGIKNQRVKKAKPLICGTSKQVLT